MTLAYATIKRYCMEGNGHCGNVNEAWESICEWVGESSDSAIVIESVKAARLPIGLQIRTAREAVLCLKGRGVESTITPDAPVSVEEAVVETHEGTRLPGNIVIPVQYAKIRDRLLSTMQYTTGSGESRTWIKEVPFAARTDSPPVLVTLCELCSSVEMKCAVWHTISLAAVPKVRNHSIQSYAQHAESKMHLQALRRFTCKESPGALDSYTSLPPPSRTSSVPLVDLARDLGCEADGLGRHVFLLLSTLEHKGTVADWGLKLRETEQLKHGFTGDVISHKPLGLEITTAADQCIEDIIQAELDNASQVHLSADDPQRRI